MTTEPGKFDAPEPCEERKLDELLRRARWPEIDQAADRRLRATWQANFAPARRRYLGPALAAAAVVLVAVSAWWMRSAPRQQVARQETSNDALVQPVVELTVVPRVAVRPPTPYERLLVPPPRQSRDSTPLVASPRPAEAPAPAVPAHPSPAPVALDPQLRHAVELLHSRDPRDHDRFVHLVADPSTRGTALEALHHLPDPPVEVLLRQLTNPHVERRFAAARALGEVCGPDVVEHLWQMVDRDMNRREALAALLGCHDPRAGHYLARAADDPGLESQLRVIRQQMQEMF